MHQRARPRKTRLYSLALQIVRDSVHLRPPCTHRSRSSVLHFQVGVVCGVGDLDPFEIDGSVVVVNTKDADASLAGNLRTFVNAVRLGLVGISRRLQGAPWIRPSEDP